MFGLAPECRGDLLFAAVRFGGALVFLHHCLEHARDVLRADLVYFGALLRLDDMTEGHGAAHRAAIVGEIAGEPLLRQRLPAADDARGIVHLEIVVAAREQALQATVDDGFLHREHDDLVIGQQVAPHRLGEGERVERPAVDRRVVHRGEHHIVALGARLGVLGIDARRGGHVEPPGGLDETGVVHLHEMALVLAGEGGAGGAVRLVAEDQVEGGEAVAFLRIADDIDGVVGGKDHIHVPGIVALADLGSELPCFGRGRVLQLMGEHLEVIFAVLLADVAVRTHGVAVQRRRRFLGPFGERLRQQREARHEEQHTATLAGQFLGNLERGEGLAGAAGHDELAARILGEARFDGRQRRLLVRAQRFLRLEDRSRVGLVLRPVDPARLQIVQRDEADRRLLPLQRLAQMAGAAGRGEEDQAMGVGLAARGGEERGQIAQRELGILVVELGLYRVQLAGCGFGHEVDAGIGAHVAKPALRGLRAPRFPQPHTGGVKVAVIRLVLEISLDQPLEVTAFLALGDRGGAKGVEQVSQGRHAGLPRSPRQRQVILKNTAAILPHKGRTGDA